MEFGFLFPSQGHVRVGSTIGFPLEVLLPPATSLIRRAGLGASEISHVELTALSRAVAVVAVPFIAEEMILDPELLPEGWTGRRDDIRPCRRESLQAKSGRIYSSWG